MKSISKVELIDLVRSKLGSNPSLRAVEEFVAAEGLVKSRSFCRSIKAAFEEERAELRERLLAAIVSKFENPSMEDFRRVSNSIKASFSEFELRTMYRGLKVSHPHLWDVRKVKTYTLRLGESDTQVFEKFSKMTGQNYNDSFVILLRSLMLAASRNQVNLAELVTRAHTLSRGEMQHLSQLLNINLHGL